MGRRRPRPLAGRGVLVAVAASLPSVGLAGPAGGQEAPVRLAEAVRDFDGDGRPDTLAVVMLEGRRYDDDRAWCGGGEKYEGDFAVVVRLAGGPATERRLGGYDFFRPGEWEVVFADYDRDGRADFNLGRYAGCNGWRYDLFTVDPSGRVRRLLTTRPLMVADRSNSTDRIRVVEDGIEHCRYSQVAGHVVERHRWDEEKRIFAGDGERLVEGCRDPG